LKDDNEYVPLDDKKVVLNVANDTGLVLTTPMTTFSGHTVMVDFSSPGLAELTPDSYNLEIEVTYSDGDVSKFPTKGGLKFNITNNLKETTGALVPTVTFDNVLEAVDEKIAVYMDTIKVGPQGPQGPAGNVDTSHDNTFTGKNMFTQPIGGSLLTKVDDFTKFSDVSADMVKYSGFHSSGTGYITDIPLPGYGVILVQPYGNNKNTGIITISYTDKPLTIIGHVTGGNITWEVQANDEIVLHKTGTETIAGDKTFTGNSNFTGQTTLNAGNYGLRVTTSGVQKTSDNGVTWTNI